MTIRKIGLKLGIAVIRYIFKSIEIV